MPAIEGSASVHHSTGVVGWDHAAVPALLLAKATINATESYLWKTIRGSGLAYSSSVFVDLEAGLVGFRVAAVSEVLNYLIVSHRMLLWRIRRLAGYWAGSLMDLCVCASCESDSDRIGSGTG